MLKKVKKINSFLLTEKPLKRNILHEVSEKYRIYENAVRLAGLFVLEYDILADRMALLNDIEGYEVLKKYDIPVVLENASMALAEFVESGEVSKLQQMHDRLSEGYDFVCDLWFKGKDSHPSFCVRMTYTVVRTHAGKGVRAFGIVQNITNQKKLEEKYAEEQRNLRERKELHLVAKSQSSLTHNCLLYYYSEAPESASLQEGMRYDDIVEMLASWAIRKEDAEACRRVLDRKRLIKLLGQGKTNFEFRYQRRQPMQNPVWISFVFNTFQVPHSDEIECFIYTYDISEQLRNAAIVKRISEMAFESVCLIYLSTGQIEFLRTAGSMFTPNRRLDYEEVCRLYRQCYVCEGEWTEFNTAVSLENIVAALQTREQYSSAYQCCCGEKVACKQHDYVWLDREQGIILAGRMDTTIAYERDKKHLAAIEKARLRAAQANEAKSVFLASMSHDLRTPLNGILGFTEIALKCQSKKEKQECLQKILSSGKLLLDLVNDTLELSRIESGKLSLQLENVDEKAFWESLIESMMSFISNSKIEFQINRQQFPIGMARMDPLKVKKVVLNLLSNAIKYTPAGGWVRFSVLSLKAPGNRITRRLVVEDNGIGMSREFLDRLYEPFSQENRVGTDHAAGTGLGLSIVQRIVRLMGGTIQVESSLHQGSKFTIDLPIENWPYAEYETVFEPEKALKPIEERKFSGQHILLCEDNCLNAEIALLLLKDKNLQVDWAKNGKLGVECFETSPVGFYAVILMDVRMPEMDGYAATRVIRQMQRADAAGVPIVAMTADAFEEDIRHSKKAGMNAHLTKPIVVQELYHILCKFILDEKSC